MNTRKLIAALMVLLVAGLLGSAIAHAARGDVTVTAMFNGRDIADASAVTPLRLEPGTLAKVDLEVTNNGERPLVVKRVELSGNILGLNFYRYVASTELTVAPGTTGSLSYQVDLTDLDTLATGLIRGDLEVSDDAGRVITTIPTVTDVRGSLWSVTGLFGLVLIVFTVVAFVRVGTAVARHRLPTNRAQRGLRFLLPGVGLLLVLGFTASVLRLWTPPAGLWWAVTGIGAAVFFVLGYFSPMPGDDDGFADGVNFDQLTDQFTEDFSEHHTDDLIGYRDTDDLADRRATEHAESLLAGEVSGSEHAGVVTVGDTGERTPDEAGR